MTDKRNIKALIEKEAPNLNNLLDPEEVKIFKGLTKSKSFEITFPKQLTIIMKFLRILPYWKYFYLIKKFTKLQKH